MKKFFFVLLGSTLALLARPRDDNEVGFSRSAILASSDEFIFDTFNGSRALFAMDPWMKTRKSGAPFSLIPRHVRRQVCATGPVCNPILECCDIGNDCCPDGGCCESGYVCNYVSQIQGFGCCPSGRTCTGVPTACAEYALHDMRSNNLCSPRATLCPFQTFCCSPGLTCRSTDCATSRAPTPTCSLYLTLPHPLCSYRLC